MRLSYSMWNVYKQCPLKYKFKYHMKLKEPFVGPAAERGTLIHNHVEDYISGKSDYLPWDENHPVERVPALGKAHPLQGLVDRLRNWPSGDSHTEYKVEFDIDWLPFPQAESSYIAVFDAAAHFNGEVEIAEWKSGKPSADHADQRKFYAMAALALWLPKKVSVTTYYIDLTGPAARTTVTPEAEQTLRDMWAERREGMLNDKVLAPRPNDKCRWCFFRKTNGGPCPMSY